MAQQPCFDLLIRMPNWLKDFPFQDVDKHSLTTRMQFVIQLSQYNVEHRSGGPFAAAVFDIQTHALIAVGVNVVVPSHASLAHAEMMALSLAQQQRQHFDLGIGTQQGLELLSSAEPCAMCLAALPWSGIQRVVCAARDADVRAIGFDEGHKKSDWTEQLKKRNISLQQDVCREEARHVLHMYAKQEGMIYNGCQRI